MIIQDIVLIVIVCVSLWCATLTKFKFLYFMPLLFVLIHIFMSNTNWFMYLPYLSAILVAILYWVPQKRWLIWLMVGIVTVLNVGLLFIPKLMNSKCFSSLSYCKAFTELYKDMKEEYALAEYKGTDLDALYEKYLPVMEEAEEEHDENKYLNALVDYTLECQDGHVNVYDMLAFFGIGSMGKLSAAKKERFTSCYSMSLLQLDDGRYVAVHVLENGAAYTAGIREGNVILSWNGKSVSEALSKLEYLVPVQTWMFADEENRERYRGFYLSCMSEDIVEVEYQNAEGVQCEVKLESEGNGYMYLRETISLWSNRVNEGVLASPLAESITYENRGDYYYININGFGGIEEDITSVMEKIVSDMEETTVSKIVVDVRNNSGGDDSLGALAVSYFASEDMPYLEEGHYDTETASYVADREILVNAKNKITAPVVLLINSQCISAGEGFVYNMAKLPQVTVVGMSGTNGSFGTFSGIHIMPEQVVVIFPNIACMGEDGEIMIDSDETKIGGIKPDIRIPVDENTAKVLFTTDQDYELEYAKNWIFSQ